MKQKKHKSLKQLLKKALEGYAPFRFSLWLMNIGRKKNQKILCSVCGKNEAEVSLKGNKLCLNCVRLEK